MDLLLVRKLSHFILLSPGEIALLEDLQSARLAVRRHREIVSAGRRYDTLFVLLEGFAVRCRVVGNAARLGPCLLEGLQTIQSKHPDSVGRVSARGLVAGLQMVRQPRNQPDHELAHAIIERCFHKGLLLFAPVGAWGQTVKIAPPLTITKDALQEGLAVLCEAVDEAIGAHAPLS